MTIGERLAKLEGLVNHTIENDLTHIRNLLYGILVSIIFGYPSYCMESRTHLSIVVTSSLASIRRNDNLPFVVKIKTQPSSPKIG